MAYVTYHIWLSKNSLVFETEIVPAHRVQDGALSLAIEYGCFNIIRSIVDALSPWDSHAMLAAT